MKIKDLLKAESIVIDAAVDSKEQAIEYLSMLQENTHTVFTGVALLHGDTIDVRCCETEVTFCPMTDTEIRWYVQTGNVL